MPIHALSRTGRYQLNDFSARCLPDVVQGWISRVLSAGGDMPSDNTIDTLTTFYNGMSAAGLLGKMKSVNCVVPDSLTAALCPLIANFGSGSFGSGSTWKNYGVVPNNLSINGIRVVAYGGASVDTGVIPSVCFSNTASAGLTIYNSWAFPSNLLDNEFGCADGAQSFQIISSYGNTTLYFAAFNGAGGTVSCIFNNFIGYMSGNRTNNTASAIYVASSTSSHHTIVSGSGIGTGPLPTNAVGFLALNDQTIFHGSYTCDKMLSFAAIHEGLTEAESRALFQLVQAMRVGLGGGFV